MALSINSYIYTHPTSRFGFGRLSEGTPFVSDCKKHYHVLCLILLNYCKSVYRNKMTGFMSMIMSIIMVLRTTRFDQKEKLMI